MAHPSVPETTSPAAPHDAPPGPAESPESPEGFEVYQVVEPQGLVRRFFTTQRHLLGLIFGALAVYVRGDGAGGARKTLPRIFARILLAVAWPFLDKELVGRPFPVQLRRRLERLGPTYIKLGQILALREDILPRDITEELKLLLSRLPAVPFSVFRELIERDVGQPVVAMYSWIDPKPLGSASIGQAHRATTIDGDAVIVKVVKPGIRETLQRDAKLLGALGFMLEIAFPRYQPRRLIREFTEYTLREVDLRREADNAETFAANFADVPDIVFPRIYRQYSARSVLTMEFLAGVQPTAASTASLSLEEREHTLDLGALAIIRMLYRDGFFHADLHPGNLMLLPQRRVGFIDLGMVGRLDAELRRMMMYYYFALVMGDAEGAARYLAAVASPGRGADPAGFRREVTEVSMRWKRSPSFEGYSLGRLILESVALGARYGMSFPVELVLMVKALVTFEGVGNVLLPGFDVAEVSRRHVRRLFIQQFSPIRVAQEGMRGTPDLVDAALKLPMLINDGIRVLEKTVRRQPDNPLAGLRGTVIAGFCLVAGAILLAFHGPWPLWTMFFVAGLLLAVRKSG